MYPRSISGPRRWPSVVRALGRLRFVVCSAAALALVAQLVGTDTHLGATAFLASVLCGSCAAFAALDLWAEGALEPPVVRVESLPALLRPDGGRLLAALGAVESLARAADDPVARHRLVDQAAALKGVAWTAMQGAHAAVRVQVAQDAAATTGQTDLAAAAESVMTSRRAMLAALADHFEGLAGSFAAAVAAVVLAGQPGQLEAELEAVEAEVAALRAWS